MTVTECEICGNQKGNRTHVAREMMFGLRDSFEYLECTNCGCLQCKSVPADLSKYYGNGYYSMRLQRRRTRRLHEAMKGLRTRTYLEGTGFIGNMLLRAFGPPGLPDWVKRAGMRQDGSILEVGCGSGDLLRTMASEGFKNLTGVDPFIKADISIGRNMKILKAEVSTLEGQYDFIVLEHSFEHMPEPHATIRKLCSLLAVNGTLIIAIPLVGYAWRHYGVHWIQLDAPRHLYLHSEKSFRLLAENMNVVDIVYDSTAMQFWGSEQYASDIPLLDERSYRVNPHNSSFSQEKIAEFQKKADDLNQRRLGDQATFYLQRRLPIQRAPGLADA
jgi:2-polyprenyl-3-methyl-5-hydroxy-6-metoxy-1,4-benzoquinol methylase